MSDSNPGTTQLQDASCDCASPWLREMLHKVRGQLDDLQANAREQARSTARNTDHLLHSHPYGAVGLGVVAGLLVGLLASRR